MTTYDAESLEWKTRAENHELPYAFQAHKLVDLASAVGVVKQGEFVPQKEVSEKAWLKLKVINRAVRLRRFVNLESVLQEGFAKWLTSQQTDDKDRIKSQIVLRRTNPGSQYFYTTDRAYQFQPLVSGLERAVTTSDLIDNPLESSFYCSRDSAIHSANRSSSDYDVGILTIREEEYLAVLERLPNPKPVNKPRQIYESAEIPTINGTSLKVALARCLHQGPLEASTVAKHLIEEINPRWIVLVGIAGGFPAFEFSLGDVVLASRYLDFSLTGAVEGSEPEQNLSGGAFHPHVEKLLKHLPADRTVLEGWSELPSIRHPSPGIDIPEHSEDPNLYGDEPWRQKVMESLRHNFGNGTRSPSFHIGPTGSSGIVLKDTKLASDWKKSARSVVDVETELAGVYSACCGTDSVLPRILAIRGISDIVGYRRGHGWLTYACNSAAAFAMALFEAGLIGNAELDSRSNN